MSLSRSRAPLAVLPFALAALHAPSLSLAQSQSPPDTLAPVVVTATRTPQPLTEVLADMTVIEREAIERSGAAGLTDLLAARVPGIAFARNGGPGATTSLYLRGAETRFTALYVDGVRIDSQTTGGAPWESLPLDQIERIEVLRGPAAAVYGSDAMAGVIQVFTRRGEPGFHPSVSVGAGRYDSGRAEASARGGSGALDYSFGLSRETSQGFNAQPAGNPDRDGFRRSSASASVGWQLDPAHRLEGTALASDLDAQYDASGPRRDDHALHRIGTLGLAWSARWSDAYRTRLGVNQGRDRYETRPSPYLAETRVTSWLLHNEWRSGGHRVTADVERRTDRLDNSSTTPPVTERSQDALALGWGLQAGRHGLALNARHDQDSEFGGQGTGSAAYGYAFAPGWRATASAGTAFRAPTLYQRFSQYGVPTLRPERARNRELGLKYAAGGRSFSAVAYRNDVSDLINFVSGPGPCANGTGRGAGCYGNVGQARLSGLTLATEQRVGAVNVGGSLDLQDPENRETGKQLARRAQRLARVFAETRLAPWLVGAELQGVGHRYNDAANTQRLGGYGLLNLYASRPLGREWRLNARLDNLADKAYETTRGYANPGRSAWVSLQWQPR